MDLVVSRRVSDDPYPTQRVFPVSMVSVLVVFFFSPAWTCTYLATDGFSGSLSKELPLEWNIRASPHLNSYHTSLLIIHPQLGLHPANWRVRNQHFC